MSSKAWIGTLFVENGSEADFRGTMDECKDIRFYVGQLESAPDTGRLHYQFYVYLHKKVRLAGLKRSLGRREVHLEQRRGSHDDAVAYCSKDESRVEGPWTGGDPPQAGKRNDLVALKNDLDGGMSIRDISSNHFGSFLRYRQSISYYVLLHQPPRTWKMENTILWGKSGSGKTRSVYEKAEREGLSVFPLAQNKNGVVWFDGYGGEDIILIDDFYGWITISYMLKLLDRYPMNCQTKGGTVPMVSKEIIITSNKAPDIWYNWESKEEEIFNAFKRRIDKVYFYDDDNKQSEWEWPVVPNHI